MMIKLNIQRFGVIGSSDATVSTLGGVSSACTFYAEVVLNSQSTNDNTSNITVNFKATSLKSSCGYGSLGSPIAYFSVDGSEKSRISVKDFKAKTTISLGSWTGNIGHNSDGTKSISVSCTYDPVKGNTGYYQYAPKKTTLSFNVTLTTIPRYFSSTPTISVSNVTETSVLINWTTPENCSQSQYKINNGSWVDVETNINKRSGSMTVPLSANTTYTIYTDFKRSDSGLWSQTKPSKSVTTYDYPKITGITVNHGDYAFVGEDYKFTVYNPLGREYNFKLYGVKENKLLKELTSKEKSTLSGFNDTTTVNNMYSSLINNSSSTFKVVTRYSGNERTFTSGNVVYKVDTNLVSPTFTDFNWEVTDNYTKNLTGADNVVIPNYSRVKVTITPEQNAVPKNYANSNYYSVLNKEFANSWIYPNTENTILESDENIPTSDTIRVSAIDSRGVSTVCDKKADVIHPIVEPVISKFSIDRLNGIDEQLFLNLEFKIWNGYFDLENTRKNKINKIRYTLNSDDEEIEWIDIDLNQFIQYATITEDGDYIVYKINDEDEDRRISCGTLETADSSKTMIEIYQGYSTYDLGYSSKNYTIPNGKIGMSRYKDDDNNYHYAFGSIPNENYLLTVAGDENVEGNLDVTEIINTRQTFETDTSMNLPNGALNETSYWCSIPNGRYFFAYTQGTYTGYPTSYGMIYKTGYYSTTGGKGDFSVLFFGQATGQSYRCSGNGNSGTVVWRKILIEDTDGGINLSNGNIYLYPAGSIQTTSWAQFGGNIVSDGGIIRAIGHGLEVDSRNTNYNAISGFYCADNSNGEMAIYTGSGTGTGSNVKIRMGTSYFRPTSNGGMTLGQGSYRWGQIYSSSGSISTSDRNLKKDIQYFDEKYDTLFDNLKPVHFKFKGNNHDRVHTGFISQDVEDALNKIGLTANDFAAFCKDEKKHFEYEYDEKGSEIGQREVFEKDDNGNQIYEYSLRYEEFIAMNTWQIQKLKKENEELKKTIDNLIDRMSKLEEDK